MSGENNLEGNVFYSCSDFKERFLAASTELGEAYPFLELEINNDDITSAKYIDYEADIPKGSNWIDPDIEQQVYINSFEEPFEIIASEYISLKNELDGATLIDNLEYIHPNRYLIRVSIQDDTGDIAPYLFPDLVSQAHEDKKGGTYQCSLKYQSSIHFSSKIYSENHCDDDFPCAEYNDAFIEIKGNELNSEYCRKLVNAFIFEVSSSVDVSIEPAKRIHWPSIEYNEITEEDLHRKRLRPLIDCDKAAEIIKLYNKAIACTDEEVSIVFFTKIIEYVSQTVVRGAITSEGKKILNSKKALSPDADFIKELEQMFVQSNKQYTKDSESLKLTITTCCYFDDLVSVLPKSLKEKVRRPLAKGNKHDALCIVADAVTSTRNCIAHAKANYTTTGNEVEPEEFSDLINVLKVLTQHVIRWYASQDHSQKVS